MNYKDLPLDQRMELASQYALMLVADIKSNEEIIGILKKDYALTREQAIQAFTAMRSNYKGEYNSTVRSNLLKALFGIGICLLAFLFYYFIGKEMGRSGTLSYVIAFIFGIGILGAIILTVMIVWGKFSKPAIQKQPFSASAPVFDKFDKTMASLFFMCIIFLCIFAWQYFFNTGIINEKTITSIHQCIITEPVRRESTGGKNPRRYYVLKLRGHNIECRFFNDYYMYVRDGSLIRNIQVWDTVSIQIFNKDLDFFNAQYSTGEINLVNLGLHGHFLVDHAYRNAEIKKSHKTNFYVLLAVFAGLTAITFLKKLFLILVNRVNRSANNR